jgi:hypothetical protein
MTDQKLFTMGADVHCSDGVCGEVTRVVVDPLPRTVTHLVVEPKHRSGLGKLVPLSLVERRGETILLRCTLGEFDRLVPAEETYFLPGNNGGYGGYSPGQIAVLPHFRLSQVNLTGSAAYNLGNAFQPVVSDTIPAGEVEVRRGESVQAVDGEIGVIQGLVIDPGNAHVSHILLQEGHLWGRKQVTIPISAVTRIDGEVRLNLTKQDVKDLPPVDIESPGPIGS